MSQWMVQLQGQEFELDTLTRLFSLPRLSIIKEEDNYLLKSDSFSALTDAHEVYKCALNMLPLINGAGGLQFEGFQRVGIDVVVEVKEDGTRSSIGYMSATIVARCHVTLDTRSSPSDPTSAEEWVGLANKHEKVAKALRILGTREKSWVELYKLYEVVHSDVGSKIIDDGWATRKKLSQFTHTANSAGSIGDDARHAKEDTTPPTSPMPLAEAETLIRGLVMRWLRSKA